MVTKYSAPEIDPRITTLIYFVFIKTFIFNKAKIDNPIGVLLALGPRLSNSQKCRHGLVLNVIRV